MIKIICDDYNIQHRNVCFYIASLVFKNAFIKLGVNCDIILHTNKNLKQICDNNIIIVFPHFYNLLNGIDCKIIFYNSECLIVDVNLWINKQINQDPRVIMVWDYCLKNIKHSILKNHLFIPPIYSDIILYNTPIITKDIDILFYGASNPIRHKRRYDIKQELTRVNNNLNIKWVETFQNLNNKIHTISRSKIVLIIHCYKEDLCIDYFRILELVLKKQFFIMEKPQIDENLLYEKYKDKIVFAEYNSIISVCIEWLKKSNFERDENANKVYDFFKNEENMNNYITNSLIEKYNLNK
jgi:hypothetical protein